MASTLQEKELFLVWSENFFFFLWKFEKSDLKPGNIIRSSKFNLRRKQESFLKVQILRDDVIFLGLCDSVPVKDGRLVIIISDETNTIIHNYIESDFILEAGVENRLLSCFRMPAGAMYPITITCITTYLKDVSEKSRMISPDLILFGSLKVLSSDFKRLFYQSRHSDVVLNVEGTDIKAHKCILQARSPVFCKMFENDSLEDVEGKVAISDIGAAAVEKFLNYLYTGSVEASCFEEYLELYYAADKYEVLSLRNFCKTKLLALTHVENACSLFALAIRHSDEDLKEQVVDIIRSDLRFVVNAESFTELSKGDITSLLRLCLNHDS